MLTRVVTIVEVSEAVVVKTSEEVTLELGVTTWVAVLARVVTMVDVSEAVVVQVPDEITLELAGPVALEIVRGDVATMEVKEVVRVITSVVETVMMAIEVQDADVPELGDDVAGMTV